MLNSRQSKSLVTPGPHLGGRSSMNGNHSGSRLHGRGHGATGHPQSSTSHQRHQHSNTADDSGDILFFGDSAAMNDDIRRNLISESEVLEANARKLEHELGLEDKTRAQLGRDTALGQQELHELVRGGQEAMDSLQMHQQLSHNVAKTIHEQFGGAVAKELVAADDNAQEVQDYDANAHSVVADMEEEPTLTVLVERMLNKNTSVVDGIEVEMAKATATFRAKQEELKALNSETEAKRRTMDDAHLQETLAKLRENNICSQATLDEESCRKANLQSALESARKGLAQAEKEFDIKKVEIEEDSNKYSTEEAKHAKILADLESENAQTQQKILATKNQAAAMELATQKFQQSKKSILELQQRTQEQIQSRSEAKVRRQQAHALKTQYETEIARMNKENARYQSDLAELAEDSQAVAKLRAQNDKMAQAEAERAEKLEQYQAQKTELERKMSAMDQAPDGDDGHENEVNALKRTRDELKDRLLNKEARLATAKTSAQAMEEIASKVQVKAESDKQELEAELELLRADHEELEAERIGFEQQLASLEEERTLERDGLERKLKILRRAVAVKRSTLEEERELTGHV